VIRQTGLPAVVTFAIHRQGLLRDGATPEDACRAVADAGADVVGLNYSRGPATMKPLLEQVRSAVSCHVAAQPVPYRTTTREPTFQSLTDDGGGHAYPIGLDPFTCTRFEMAQFARDARDLGAGYIGICCGGAPHHVRAMAEALGREVPASRYSPDISLHPVLGDLSPEHAERFAHWRE